MQAVQIDRSPSFGEYLDAWLAHAKGRVRQKTWEGYETLIRLYAKPALGDQALSELQPLISSTSTPT